MAYKFQLGNAKLAGTLEQVGGLASTPIDDATAANVVAQIDSGEIPIAKLAASTISGKALGNNLGALTAANNSGIVMSSYNGSADIGDIAVEIKANTGITKDNDGLQLSLANNKALEFDSGALAVKVKGNSGLGMDGDGLSVSVHSDALQFDGVAIDLKDTIAGARTFSANNTTFTQEVRFSNTQNAEIRLNDTAEDVQGKNMTIRAGSTTANNTNNIGGGNLVFQAGQGKGSGNGGNIDFQVASAGSSGNSLNGLNNAMSISQNKSVIMNQSLEVGTTIQTNGGIIRMGNTNNAEMTINDTAHNVAGKALLIRAGKPVSGTTSDIAGGNIIVEAGQGKGTGVGGSIEFKVSTAAGSTANSLNATNRALIITQDKNAQFAGDLTVDGDLIVSGDTVTMNVANLAVEDNLIVIRNGAAAADNSGIQIGTSGTPVTLKMTDSAANLSSSVPLKASSFIGALNGNANTATTATTATNATNVAVAADATNGSQSVLFTVGTSGNLPPKTDPGLTYNPSSNVLTCAGGFVGTNRPTVALKAAADTLIVGVNYVNNMGSDGTDTVTLPASPTVGDVVYVKAPGDTSASRILRVSRAGSQTIDGEQSLDLVSPDAAITLIYVAGDTWKIW